MYSSTLPSTLALDWGGWSTPRPPGKTRYPFYRRLGEPPGPVWTGAENLAPTGIRSPDHPACIESLYRLSYPGTTVQTWGWFTNTRKGLETSRQEKSTLKTPACWEKNETKLVLDRRRVQENIWFDSHNRKAYLFHHHALQQNCTCIRCG